jgi:hypothetical protein
MTRDPHRAAVMSILVVAVLIGLLAIVLAPPTDAERDACIDRVVTKHMHTSIAYDEGLIACEKAAHKRRIAR